MPIVHSEIEIAVDYWTVKEINGPRISRRLTAVIFV